MALGCGRTKPLVLECPRTMAQASLTGLQEDKVYLIGSEQASTKMSPGFKPNSTLKDQTLEFWLQDGFQKGKVQAVGLSNS